MQAILQYFHFNVDSWPDKFAVVAILLVLSGLSRVYSSMASTDQQKNSAQQLVETCDSLTIALGLVLLLVQPFIVQTFWVPSGSMENTLLEQDRILVSKLIYRISDPRPGDIVVFKAPPEAIRESLQPDGTDFVKRCIGAPGDVVTIQDRALYRNGKLIAEPYTRWGDDEGLAVRFSYDMKIVDQAVYYREYDPSGIPGKWQHNQEPVDEGDQLTVSEALPGKIPPGEFLMLGDHRNASLDGHYWGFVPRANIVGKAFCVFWPLTRLRVLDHAPAK